MTKDEMRRLIGIEKRVREIADESGLLTTDIDFEICPARRILEAMSYHFPTNYAHWTFGREFDRNRTIYEHTGAGIPYEQVWNFDRPRALLVETNPFALNAMVIAHVYGHVDFFLGNSYLKHGRSFADISKEAGYAAERFRKYEARYGHEAVEKILDAALSICWHQPADILRDEQKEEEMRNGLIEDEKVKLAFLEKNTGLNSKKTKEEREFIEKRLRHLEHKTPPMPEYDLLHYIILHSTYLKSWQKDILSVVRNQARTLAPNMRTKMLNEGWATYWHLRIMRQLTKEGLITNAEHGVWTGFHSKVTKPSKFSINVYHLGPALLEYAEEIWNTGRFGREYEECDSSFLRETWNTHANKGKEKLFAIRERYCDRMGVEEFATDEFIRSNKLYIYRQSEDPRTGETVAVIVEKKPAIIRLFLKRYFSYYGIPPIAIVDGNFLGSRICLLKHDDYGMDLDERYIEGTLRNIFYLWGHPVYLNSAKETKNTRYQFDGKKYLVK